MPTWAVKAKAPFSGAHEYLVGGNSPLALLPGRAWALVESMNDELLVEVGVYAGEGGLGEDGGWDPRATEGGGERTSAGHGAAVRARWKVRQRVFRGGVEDDFGGARG